MRGSPSSSQRVWTTEKRANSLPGRRRKQAWDRSTPFVFGRRITKQYSGKLQTEIEDLHWETR